MHSVIPGLGSVRVPSRSKNTARASTRVLSAQILGSKRRRQDKLPERSGAVQRSVFVTDRARPHEGIANLDQELIRVSVVNVWIRAVQIAETSLQAMRFCFENEPLMASTDTTAVFDRQPEFERHVESWNAWRT